MVVASFASRRFQSKALMRKLSQILVRLVDVVQSRVVDASRENEFQPVHLSAQTDGVAPKDLEELVSHCSALLTMPVHINELTSLLSFPPMSSSIPSMRAKVAM